jgi:PAS domain S-box-containing protein
MALSKKKAGFRLAMNTTSSKFGMLTSFIRQAEALKGHIEMLDSLFRHATEGIVVVNAAGNIAMVNPRALSLFGYEFIEELVGKGIELLIPKRLSGRHTAHREGFMREPLARKMGIGRELLALRKDGSEFPVEVSLSPFSTSEGQFVVSFIIDITERKKHEKAIVEANQAIVRLNAELEARVDQRTKELAEALEELNESKMEVIRALESERELNELKSQFVTIASHEFRTPLATMLSSVSLIGRYRTTDDDEKRQKHVQRIKSAINNLTEILNDFLSLGKLEEGLLKSVPIQFNLPAFCAQLVDELRGVCKPGQSIDYEHEGEEVVSADNQLLKNIVINVVSNGLKYSTKDIRLNTRLENGVVYIEVNDQGIGIPDSDLPHIFNRFFRANNSGNVQGTGLGLNIVKKYLELMKGDIKVTSKVGQGSTFYIEFPAGGGGYPQ